MLDDVAAYLLLAPIAVVIAGGCGAAVWLIRRRPASVRVETTRHKLSN